MPTTAIAKAAITTIRICICIPFCTSSPVGGVNVTSSVALESLSLIASSNSPSLGFTLPGVVVSSLLPTEFSYLTTSVTLSNVKFAASSVFTPTVFVTFNSIDDL
jgi:hypothetical protein